MERKESSAQSTKDTEYGTVQYEDELAPSWRFWKKRRHIVAVLAFLGFFTSYILRVNLSVAIVAMTEIQSIDENGKPVREFDWDSKMQGLLLSSFFYGYLSTQLFGGWLSARIGGKRVFGIGIAITAFFTIITPPLVQINVYIFLALRIVEGVCEGVTYPCIHAIWSYWAPPLERSKLATFAFSGSFFGTVFAMPVAGVMVEYLGWSSVFYVFGAAGLVWFFFWWIIVKDKPEEDPHISKAELEYIKSSLGVSRKEEASHKITHPWKSMLTSPPVWAIIAAHFSENWGFYTMLTQLPTFMNDVLNFKLDKTGYLSALPYLAMAITVQFSGHLADYFRSKKILTTTQVRKIFNCGAFLFQTIFMLCAAFILTPVGVVTCITLGIGLGGFAWSGFGVNHLDIAPKHASVLMGIGNTIATLPGVISPIITGYIVQNKTAEEWRTIFIIAATIYLIGAMIYGLFASGEKQSWADKVGEQKANKSYDNPAMETDNL